MDISIKNMVCKRCIMVVSQIFDKAKIEVAKVQLGKVETAETVSPDALEQINIQLKSAGFEILNDSWARLKLRKPFLPMRLSRETYN